MSSLGDYNKGDLWVFPLDLSSVCPSVMAVVRFYSDEVVDWRALQRAAKLCPQLSVTTELCYNVELTGEHQAPEVSKEAETPPADHDRLSVLPRCLSVRPTPPPAGFSSLGAEQKDVLLWLFRPPLQEEPLSETPRLTEGSGEKLVEIGPRYRWTQAVLSCCL